MARGRKFAAFDPSGGRYEVTEDVWRDKVLPSMIKESWNNPDALYQTLHLALTDGFFAQALPGAKRLIELERTSERATLILANAQWKLGQLDESSLTVERFHGRTSPKATTLTHLATLAAERGESDRATTLLWQALQIDPNNDKAANWWPLLERDRTAGGRDAHVNALRLLAELPGSWRALVGLARVELDQKQIERAIAFFEEALKIAPDADDLLLTISGDLGNAGRPGDALRLVVPHYDSRHHDPLIGTNLLHAAVAINDLEMADRVLASLQSLGRWDLKEPLAEARQVIDRAKRTHQ
jgi:tetratricopeptide (TPR) repeat protein